MTAALETLRDEEARMLEDAVRIDKRAAERESLAREDRGRAHSLRVRATELQAAAALLIKHQPT